MASVLVLGGGAAGLVAAWRAASLGHAVRLVEGNARLGAKLLVTGGGNCNLTHAGGAPELLKSFAPRQARFLRAALRGFGPRELRALLAERGLETTEREDGRVFPVLAPGGARAVLALLEDLAREAGVRVMPGIPVSGLRAAASRVQALALQGGGELAADAFILATGGPSWPSTGARGDALDWLAALGLPVVPWSPALAPIPLQRPRPEWEGVSLRGGELRLQAGPSGKRLAAWAGDMVFTRAGLSGPAALGLSAAVEAARRQGPVELRHAMDVRPPEALDTELLGDQRLHPRMALRTWLRHRLPERLCDPLLAEAALDPAGRLADLSREGRKALAGLVSALPLGAPRPLSLAQGEVCAGGLALEAVDPASMRVKGWENLRVCGELLDVDGPVGGYNLQAAFSTGWVAGGLEGD